MQNQIEHKLKVELLSEKIKLVEIKKEIAQFELQTAKLNFEKQKL